MWDYIKRQLHSCRKMYGLRFQDILIYRVLIPSTIMRFNQLQYADDSLYKKDLVVKELIQISASRLLISDESFSGKPVYFSYLNRSIIAKRLADIFPNAEIILFLRDQRDIILSHYSSYIKMPYGTKTIEKLFYRPKTNYTHTDYLKAPHRSDMNSLL